MYENFKQQPTMVRGKPINGHNVQLFTRENINLLPKEAEEMEKYTATAVSEDS